MRAHVCKRVFLAPRKTRKKLGIDGKDGGATTKRGSARRWFHHIYFAMLSALRVNQLAKVTGLLPQYLILGHTDRATLVYGVTVYVGPSMR
jgi:hypothetical protein